MAVKFLSQEWADALTEKLNADDSFTSSIAGKKAKIQQNVTGGAIGGSIGGDFFKVEEFA